MTLIYEAPWICHAHQYWTQDKKEFFEHLHNVPHRQYGDDNCARCGIFCHYDVEFTGLNEPVIPLCEVCKKIPNVKEYVRAKRRAEFPPEKSVKTF
jgi:hypothetical protein